jgi:hypothetical protein
MLIPREGSLRLAAFGTLRMACAPIAVNLAWKLIFGINNPMGTILNQERHD